MKLDIDLIQEILTELEENTDGPIEKDAEYSCSNDPEKMKKNYHLKILIDEGFIEGYAKKHQFIRGNPTYIIGYTELTFSGHQLLDTLKNDTLKNRILDSVKDISVTTLKQIPALAISLLLGA